MRSFAAAWMNAVLIAGCSSAGTGAVPGSSPTGSPVTRTSTAAPSSIVAPPSTVAAAATPDPATGTRSPAIGLPDPFRTPGATNPDVTPATLASTICSRGWTATVRPPASYTGSLKHSQLASGYSIGSDRNPADYEEDHLVPLEIGGHPTAETNLWPEPRAGVYGAGTKDKLENVVNHMVCGGSMSLADAQKLFMTDWIAAAKRFGLV